MALSLYSIEFWPTKFLKVGPYSPELSLFNQVIPKARTALDERALLVVGRRFELGLYFIAVHSVHSLESFNFQLKSYLF